MTNKLQPGISIKIEAFLPTGSSIEENYTALSMVRDAEKTKDYAAVLTAAVIDRVAIKQISRRVPVEGQEMPLTHRGKAAAEAAE